MALAVSAEWLAAPTKSLLMPALLVAFFVGLDRRRPVVLIWGGLAILFSWAGDVLLSSPGGAGFLVGLGCFAVAHGCYLVLFLRAVRERRIPLLALLLLPWWIVLLLFLAPHAGALVFPVAVYGLLLGAVAAVALAGNRVVAVGGLAFLASDTLLSLKLFLPGFYFVQQDVVIMFFYILGQGLIVAGVLRHEQTAVVPSASQ